MRRPAAITRSSATSTPPPHRIRKNGPVTAERWFEELLVTELFGSLAAFDAMPGDVLLREGEPGDSFLVVISGEADVRRATTHVATVGAGSVLGELALLTGEPRTTNVVAKTRLSGRRGTTEQFDSLLDIPDVRDHFTRLAAERLAANVEPVPFTTEAGFVGLLRPLLPSDRAEFLELLGHFSPESRRRRFFSQAKLSPALIDYLLDIDYLNHFAWIILEVSNSNRNVGAAIGRLIRDASDPTSAEVACAVVDEHQGRGLGTVLLGALAVAAQASGITTLTAEVLDENTSMRHVFAKAHARWTRADRGVLAATMTAATAGATINADLADRLTSSVHGIGLAAATALQL